MQFRFLRRGALPVLCSLTLSLYATPVLADSHGGVQAVIDEYIRLESVDLAKQGELMTDDRVYIIGGTRQTDNVANMRAQVAGEKLAQALDPDAVMVVTAEDVIVRMYGDTAVASFFRHWQLTPGPQAVRDGVAGNAPPTQVVTLVLAKMGQDWKIVHTHTSVAQ